jgi:hypothetical protein
VYRKCYEDGLSSSRWTRIHQALSHPPYYGVEKRQLTVGQSCSTSNGPSFNLGNISTAEPAPVETAKRTRCHILFDSSTCEQSNNT